MSWQEIQDFLFFISILSRLAPSLAPSLSYLFFLSKTGGGDVSIKIFCTLRAYTIVRLIKEQKHRGSQC